MRAWHVVKRHLLARQAKDAASASVFVLVVLTLALWCVALLTVY